MSEGTHKLEVGVLKGVTKPTIEKLNKGGIPTLEALAVTPARHIVALTGMGVETAQKAIDKARAILKWDTFMPFNEYQEARVPRIRCSTGSSELDRILGGGIETGSITELAGAFSSGKTQICFTLAVLSHLPVEAGGLGGNVAVIDTEETFKDKRIFEIAKARGLDPAVVAGSLFIAPAYTADHLMDQINRLHQLIQDRNVKLIIVDSVMSHFRSEYIGRGTLSARQGQLGSALSTLLRISQANNVAVVITNQCITTPDASTYSNPHKPTGGNVMGHAATVRVWLFKAKQNQRLANILDSSYLKDEKIRFMITDKGVVDMPGVKDD